MHESENTPQNCCHPNQGGLVDPDKQDARLLLTAIKNNDISSAKRLLERKLNLDMNLAEVAQSRDCETTFLLEAIRSRRFEMVQLLIDSGADLVNVYKNRHGPMHQAIKIMNHESRWKMVKLLFAAGLTMITEKEDPHYATACIQLAVENNDFELVKFFMDAGANLNRADDENDFGPLHVAVSLGSKLGIKMIDKLVKAGADVNLNWKTGYVRRPGDDVKFRKGYTCLYFACGEDDCDTELIRALFAAGASLNTLHGKFLISPLARAVQNENNEVVEEMLRLGADVNLSQLCSDSPLESAVQMQNVELVELLLEHGANINALDPDGKNILYCAAENYVDDVETSYIEVLEVLIDNGAKLSLNGTKFEPFDAVLKYGTLEAVELFIANGFDLNSCRGRFPLHLAAKNSKAEVIEFLLESGLFDVNELDATSGCTPLFIAVSNRNFTCARLLVEWNADVNIPNASDIGEDRNVRGRTPLIEAFTTGRVIYVDLLLSSNSISKLCDRLEDMISIINIAIALKRDSVTRSLFGIMVRLESQGFSIDPVIRKLLRRSFSESRAIINKCRSELWLMKDLNFHRYFTFYDLLTKADITAFVNNEDIVRGIYSDAVDRILSIYANQMKFRHSIAWRRRKYMENAESGLCEILGSGLLYCFMIHHQIKTHLSMADLCVLSQL